MLEKYVEKYVDEITKAIDNCGTDKIEAFLDHLVHAYNNKLKIFVVGNGGSASTANHFVCDLEKNVGLNANREINIISLCESVEKITAYSNDFSYEDVFSIQLEKIITSQDIIIVISASGNSKNVVNACKIAKKHNAFIITMSGFKGGEITEYADIPIVVPLDTYEQIEDAHLIILHMVIRYLKTNLQILESC